MSITLSFGQLAGLIGICWLAVVGYRYAMVLLPNFDWAVRGWMTRRQTEAQIRHLGRMEATGRALHDTEQR